MKSNQIIWRERTFENISKFIQFLQAFMKLFHEHDVLGKRKKKKKSRAHLRQLVHSVLGHSEEKNEDVKSLIKMRKVLK